MAGVTKEQLKKEIAEILKNADLTVLSAKKVRLQLEKKLGCDLAPRKKEIDSLVMEYVNAKEKNNASGSEDEESEAESEESEESEEEPPKNKRSAPARKAPVKKAKKSSTEDESGSGDNASDEEYSPNKSASKSKKGGKKKNESDSDSDEDWKRPPAKRAKKAAGAAGTGKGKGTGFTRALTLSPDLAALMGAESLPRHEVVKKMWAMIKERNLYDPKNKQYAICDNELYKVFGVKRFRTFGMLKYLRPHFID